MLREPGAVTAKTGRAGGADEDHAVIGTATRTAHRTGWTPVCGASRGSRRSSTICRSRKWLQFMGLLGCSRALWRGRAYQRFRLKHSANFFRASPVFLSGTFSFREPRSVSLSVGAVANFATICLFAERTTPAVPRYPYGSNPPHRLSSKTSSIKLTSDSSSRFPENFCRSSVTISERSSHFSPPIEISVREP